MSGALLARKRTLSEPSFLHFTRKNRIDIMLLDSKYGETFYITLSGERVAMAGL